MQNEKNKLGIDTLWQKYQKTLELLADALERLEQKPKEIIKEVEKIVEIEQIKEVPVTEFVEVPKIVEKEKIVDLSQEQRDQYEKIILDLKNEIESLKFNNQQVDYWGRPKNPSKHLIDNRTADQKLEQRYFRLVQEVKQGKLDINTLSHAEQEVVNKLLNE